MTASLAKRALGFAVVCVVMAALTASPALAAKAKVKLSGPSQISASQPFYLVAKGKGKRKHKKYLLGLFVTRQSSCPSTYADAFVTANTGRIAAYYVGRRFKVKFGPVRGGSPGVFLFCAYLYPKVSGGSWGYKKPMAIGRRLITFT